MTLKIMLGALALAPLFTFATALAAPAPSAPPKWDWANLTHYREANAKLGPPARGERRVVFIGPSVIENWGQDFHGLFPGKPYVNRGIGGQTMGKVLLRFRQDAVDLKPKAVVIYPGINDFATNDSPTVLNDVESCLMSMVDLARVNHIRVILASDAPVTRIPWAPNIQPAQTVRSLNAWIRDYAKAQGLVYLDFETGLSDENGAYKAEWTSDGVHATLAGYKVMASLAQAAIDKALSGR